MAVVDRNEATPVGSRRRETGRSSVARSFVGVAALLVAVGVTTFWKPTASASQPAPTTSLPPGPGIAPDQPISGVPRVTAPAPPTVPPLTPPVLEIALPSAVAGGEARVTGSGCPGSVPVVVTIDDREVGRAIAGGRGEFDVRVDLRDIDVGRRRVVARCGATTLESTLDVVLNSTSPAAGSATVAVMVAFFVLAALIVLLRGESDAPSQSAATGEES